ncbi:MAG: hemin ABC transporter substrate-binding protein [Alphaproteobacteria bacterium]
MRIARLIRCAVAAACGLAVAQAAAAETPQRAARLDVARIVSVNGAVTEIVYALGADRHLVGVDTTSLFPPEALAKLPNVGYVRALSAEGILSLRPSMVLLTKDAGPPAVLAQLRAAGVNLVSVPDDYSVRGVADKIRAVAMAVGKADDGERMATRFLRNVASVERTIAGAQARPKVLFVLSAARGAAMAAGQNTAADAMIRLAGGVNAVQGYDGYKPFVPEAVVGAAPEFFIIASHALDNIGGVEKFLARPEVANTPAGQAKRVIVMNSAQLLGFGPRTAHAMRDLAQSLHPGLQFSALE